MAKVGSWKWEGKQRIQKSLDRAHLAEIDRLEDALEELEENQSDSLLIYEIRERLFELYEEN